MRLLTAGSLVRAQQGEPKVEHPNRCSFFGPRPISFCSKREKPPHCYDSAGAFLLLCQSAARQFNLLSARCQLLCLLIGGREERRGQFFWRGCRPTAVMYSAENPAQSDPSPPLFIRYSLLFAGQDQQEAGLVVLLLKEGILRHQLGRGKGLFHPLDGEPGVRQGVDEL